MLYSLLWYRTRTVPMSQRWGDGPEDVSKWDEEQTAFGETQYFTEQRYAQDWAQRYASEPLDWTSSVGYLCATHNDLHFQIETKDVDVNPWDVCPLPSDFRTPRSHGD